MAKSMLEQVGHFIESLGDNKSRGGLIDTPARFLKAWGHWASGYQQQPEDVLKLFDDGAEGFDEIIAQTNIPIYSHCEHHLAPFFGVAHIGYIPKGRVVGLSKMKRLVDVFAHRLQVQERLTTQIADAFFEHVRPEAVGVILQCRHLCMESRGIRTAGTMTMTSAMRGAFRNDQAARQEFLALIKIGGVER